MLSKTPVHLYQGSNVALGTAAGKLFRVGCVLPFLFSLSYCFLTFFSSHSVMSIENAGDSDLLSVTSQ
jgi:large subunit ribosomal protein L30e